MADREAAATPAPLAPAPAVPVTPQAPQPPAHVVAAAAPPPAVATVQPKPGKGFLWPAQGPVISEFGSSSKGVHNDGINIAVDKGTPVLASEDGIVAYSGNELRGFGNLLLIKHPDGLMTAYAHNDALLVKRGESVRRGQQIAKSGDTGGVSQPQLHFEVRQGTRAVDPMPYLRGGMTPVSAPGGVSPGSSPADPPDPG